MRLEGWQQYRFVNLDTKDFLSNKLPRRAPLLRREQEPAVVDQVFQPVRRHVQRDDVAGFVLTRRLFQTLSLQHAVDLALYFVELRLSAGGPDASAKRIEHVQCL